MVKMLSYNQLFMHSWSTRFIELLLLYSMLDTCCLARGPHHPNSQVKRVEDQKHINQHLAYETEHIEEDLKEHQLPADKSIEQLSDEEKNYLFFKVHDLDGNDKLDGLEIFHSATHHSFNHNPHVDEHDTETDQVNQESQPVINDSGANLSIPDMKLLKLNENEQLIDENLNHVVDVLDNFLALADLNNDGYLNYAEYAAAMKIGNTVIEDEQEAEL